MNILKLLKQPYPLDRTGASVILSSVLTGLFIALFLLFFQPFGISELQHPHKTLIFSVYGIITAVIMLVFRMLPVLLPGLMREERWTVGREIGWTLLMIFSIAVANLFYSVAMGFAPLNAQGFITYIIYTLALAVFPVVIMILLSYNRSLRRHVQAASVMNEQIGEKEHEEKVEQVAGGKHLSFVADNNKDKLELKDEQLLYIESADNYSSIIYVEEGKIKKQLLRASLKRMEEQVNVPFVIRCHRAYIVNLHKVRSVSGNSQGYKLHFEETDLTVPVSRTLGKELLSQLRSVSFAHTLSN